MARSKKPSPEQRARSLVDRQRRIRACREPDCVDGFRIRVEEREVDLTGKVDIDGKALSFRTVRTRYASACPSCNPEPRSAEQQSILDEQADAARRSAGA